MRLMTRAESSIGSARPSWLSPVVRCTTEPPIWSEVLDADTVEWFKENGGLTRANGDRFRERLLGVGGSKDPLEAFRDFRGRDADIQPLLDRRGLN